MKLVIDIPNEAYSRLLEEQHLPNRLDIEYFIVHGVPLEEKLANIKTELQDEKESYISEVGKCGFTEGITFAIETIDEYIGENK